MDLSNSLQRAVDAARHGDLDSLEIELGRLSSLPGGNVPSVARRLRAMANSAQAHPSFQATPQARAV